MTVNCATDGDSADLPLLTTTISGTTTNGAERRSKTPPLPGKIDSSSSPELNREPQMAKMPWYPRDFASSTRGWPLVPCGALRELLDVQWDMGSLPADSHELRPLSRATPAQWRFAWKYIEPKFLLALKAAGEILVLKYTGARPSIISTGRAPAVGQETTFDGAGANDPYTLKCRSVTDRYQIGQRSLVH